MVEDFHTYDFLFRIFATRNFFIGREPQIELYPFNTYDIEKANKIAAERMGQIGIDVRDPSQAVGTMSGGER